MFYCRLGKFCKGLLSRPKFEPNYAEGTEGQTDKQTERGTDRQADRETNRQRER